MLASRQDEPDSTHERAMNIAKYQTADGPARVALVRDDVFVPLELQRSGFTSLTELLDSRPTSESISALAVEAESIAATQVQLLAPIDQQEVWAAGVTYKRSQAARMEESAAAASCYDRVYGSPRPELFFKATPNRVVGHGGGLRIRADSKWNVPEPEITLALTSRLEIVGFTIGNDMSSRDIEGENPLYLPQAKMYNQCCGLGPWITLVDAMPPLDQIEVRLTVGRGGVEVFAGETSSVQLARTFEDLLSYLGRDNSFPCGAFLLTGTGIVPDSDFTLLPDDEVHISVSGIGTLTNKIIQS